MIYDKLPTLHPCMHTPNIHGGSVRPPIRRCFLESILGSVQPLDEISMLGRNDKTCRNCFKREPTGPIADIDTQLGPWT